MIGRAIDNLGERLWGRDRYRRKYYKLAKRIAAIKGFEVYKPHLVWLTDEEFVAAREKTERRGIEGGPNDRCYTLLAAARSANSTRSPAPVGSRSAVLVDRPTAT